MTDPIRGRLTRWGDAYGIPLSKQDVERLGLQPGQEVWVRLERGGLERALARFPLIKEGDPEESSRHDEHLGRASLERWRDRQRRVADEQRGCIAGPVPLAAAPASKSLLISRFPREVL